MSVATRNMIAALASARTGSAEPAALIPDFGNIEARQYAAWSAGDYSSVGKTLQTVDENLSEALDIHPTEKVLDFPADNVNVQLTRAEALPFTAGAFDVVTSCFGAMFAPDHKRAAAELLRICRPGGRIGLACWTRDSFTGQVFRTIGRYLPVPDGCESATRWGTREYLNELFGEHADALGAATRSYVLRYESTQQWLESWRSFYAPLQKVIDSVDPDWRDQLTEDLLALADRFNEADDGTMVIEDEYLEFLIHKSSWRNI